MGACKHYPEGEPDGLGCQLCEDDKAREWKLDGHALVCRYYPEGRYVALTIICPRHEGRECAPEPGTTKHITGDCAVKEEFSRVGGELFNTYRHAEGRGRIIPLPGAFRWRWHIEYGEEPEAYIEVELL